MATIILGAFEDRDAANAALKELGDLGYMAEEVSVISADKAGDSEMHSAKKGALGTVGAGAIIGGLAGLIATVGVFPALTGLIIGGPIVALMGLTGAATGA